MSNMWPYLVYGLYLLFGGISVWLRFKQKVFVGKVPWFLAWYEIAASVISTGVLLFVVANFLSGFLAFLLCLMSLAVGVLGIVGGGNLISGRTFIPSLIWGLLQLVSFEINLHWTTFKFTCVQFFEFSFYLVLGLVEGIKPGVGISFRIFASKLAFEASAYSPGRGYGLYLNVNLVAIIFLILLLLSRRSLLARKQQTTAVPPENT